LRAEKRDMKVTNKENLFVTNAVLSATRQRGCLHLHTNALDLELAV
jgi:hypothetical protein